MYILASKSPRRIELLKILIPQFEVIPPKIPEIIPDGVGDTYAAEYLAVKKARSVAEEHPEDIVIGADTVVFCDEMYGKPESADDALRMIGELSGRVHSVFTGVCIACGKNTHSFTERTLVEFDRIPISEIRNYVKSGSPLDKAGAYGIQDDFIKKYCRRIEGSYENIVGLPLAKLRNVLELIESNEN
ncbi:MAG: Maf family protein [Ruminococcus sp.]|jgi:septum formation protein|nr:Maf family protein [Ruminococcus sp.]